MIFFLYGTDTYRSRQKLKEIKDKFKKEVDPSGLNLMAIDGAKTDLDSVNRAMSAAPFLAKRRMVVVEELFANKKEGLFEGLLEKLKKESASTDPSSCLMIFWEPIEGPDKRNKDAAALWNFLTKEKFAAPYPPLAGLQLSRWVAEYFAVNGVNVDPSAADRLVALVGDDSWTLKNEIEKLAAFAKGSGQPVSSEMVGQQVTAQFDDNIFALVDAVSQRQKNVALKLVSEQLDNGANEMYLLSMINRAFRILTLVKETPAAQQGKLGLHPFVLKKAQSQSQRFSGQELKNIYRSLLRLDEQIKTGFAKPAVLIDLFLVSV